jgi:hypothetical protein
MRVALLAVSCVALAYDHADACDCVGPDWFAPANDTVDVPTNLASITYSSYETSGARSLHDEAGNESDLGTVVQYEGYSSPVARVEVNGSLLPNTRYDFTYRDYNGPQTLSFTTGSSADTTAPAPLAVTDISAEYTEYGSFISDSCGNRKGNLVGTVADAEPGASLVVHITGTNFNETRTVASGAGFYLSTGSCSLYLDISPCSDYTVEAWQVDLAGNPSPRSTHSVHVLGCPPVNSESDRGCQGYTGPDVCKPYGEHDDDDAPSSSPGDDGGCATGGASILGSLASLGLLALRTTSRAASGTRSPRA